MTTPAAQQSTGERGSGLADSRLRVLLTALLLAVAAWSLYLPSAGYGFVYYDDIRVLRDHPDLYGQENVRDNLQAILRTLPREEPLVLRDVSWMLDSRLFGFGEPFGYHLGNVLLHGAVAALLFLFLLDTTRRYGFALATTAAWLALAVHVEPVAWIMGRKDVLSTLFMLLALCAQTRRLGARGWPARGAWYVLTLVFFLGGLLSKINVLSFPAVLYLHAVFFPYLRRERTPGSPFPWRRALGVELLLMAPALLAAAGVYSWYRDSLAQMGLFDRGYTARGLAHLWNLVMVNPMALWLYLRQLVLPQGLSLLYTWPRLLTAYPQWQVVASLATVAAAAAAGGWLFVRRKDLFFYYASFFVLMVPYANLEYIGIWVADRYLYFTSFCLLAIAASLAGEALRGPLPALRVAVLTAAVAFVGVNVVQKLAYLREWRTAETLWQYHITLPHAHATAYENLAAYYYAIARNSGDAARAVAPLRKMEVVVNTGLDQFWPARVGPPPYKTAYLLFLRSLIEEIRGEPETAVETLLLADRTRPRFEATNRNLAYLYARLASETKNRKKRAEYTRASWERFNEFQRLAFRGRPLPPEALREKEALRAQLGIKGP